MAQCLLKIKNKYIYIKWLHYSQQIPVNTFQNISCSLPPTCERVCIFNSFAVSMPPAWWEYAPLTALRSLWRGTQFLHPWCPMFIMNSSYWKVHLYDETDQKNNCTELNKLNFLKTNVFTSEGSTKLSCGRLIVLKGNRDKQTPWALQTGME